MEHRGHRARLKTRFLQESLDNFEEHEVLELLLYYSIPQGDVNPTAHRLIDRFGSLSGVLDADPDDLTQAEGIGAHSALLLHLMPALFRRYHQARYGKKPILDSTQAAKDYCAGLYHGVHVERLYLLCLNASRALIRTILLQEGTLDRVAAYPREAAAAAMSARAHAVLLSHNHPGGQPTPSAADQTITNQIARALEPLGIELLDHILVANGAGVSLKENSADG